MNDSASIARFVGAVTCQSGPGSAGRTLLGRIAEADGSSTAAQLSLLCREAVDLPAQLDGVSVLALGAQQVLLRAGAHEWTVACHTWQLHRNVGAMFYAAIPPRPTPLGRRLSWRVLLGIAGTAPGRWLLSRRSRVN